MSVEKNKTIVRRFYEEVVNTGKVDGIEEYISEEYAEVYELKRHVVGIEGAKAHSDDFLDCVRSRRKPNADVEIGCRTVTVCHLGNIAYRLNRPIKWDPVAEEIVGDDDAARWLDRSRREPFNIL